MPLFVRLPMSQFVHYFCFLNFAQSLNLRRLNLLFMKDNPSITRYSRFMELTWLGTAGFIARTKDAEVAFDPFLSRGIGVQSPFTANSFQNTQAIFVGHGHFDHTFDIPKIAAQSEVRVVAPGLTRQVLNFRGVAKSQLEVASNDKILFSPMKVRAFKSAHVKFDLPLVISTIRRCGISGCVHIAKLGLGYPQGLVQSYLFEKKGKKFLFLSSAGCTEAELQDYRRLEIDFLLAPLQGHSRIQSIVADLTTRVQPKVVIPHHHDDFYPPLSQGISVEVFKDQLKQKGYKGKVLEIPLFQAAQV